MAEVLNPASGIGFKPDVAHPESRITPHKTGMAYIAVFMLRPIIDVTVDRNLSFQQRLIDFNLGVIVLKAPTNRLQDLLPLIPRVLDAIPSIAPGSVVIVA